MTAYLVRRTVQAVLTLLVVSIAVFLLMKLYPGDPGAIMLGRHATPAKVRELDLLLGAALPWPAQYLRWLGLLFAGGLEGAFLLLPATLLLLLVGGGLGVALAVALASWQARFPHSLLDRAASALSLLFYAFPSFWVAATLFLWLGIDLGWVPLVPPGFPGDQGVADWALSYVVPVAAIAVTSVAGWSMHLRAALEEALRSDYVRTARAKGLPERLVVRRHVLRSAWLPLLSILGMTFPVLLSNLIVVESTLPMNSIGGALVGAIYTRAYGSVLDLVMVIGILTVGLNLLADLVAAAADPRIRFG